MARRRRLRVCGALLGALAAFVAIAPRSASGEETDGAYTWGFWSRPAPNPDVGPFILDTSGGPGGFTCSVQARVWAQESATSGITRMRISFHKYAHYSPTAPIWAHASSTELAYPNDESVELPDDDREFFISALLPWGFLDGTRGEQVIARFVGERPSMWNPDVVDDLEVGKLTCDAEACVGPSGTFVCPQSVRGDPSATGGIDAPPGLQSDPHYRDSDGDGIPDDAEYPTHLPAAEALPVVN